MAITSALREVLNQGISSGSFIDTKIILYSYRDSSGRVCRPKALYGNSNVLKTVPYFNDLLFGDFVESRSKDFGDPVDEEEFAEDYGYLSDSDLEEDGEEKVESSAKRKSPSGVHPFDPFATPTECRVASEVHLERIEKGKVVKIPDIAFVTFQAFLMYLYTDVMKFAPFGSEENRRSRSVEAVATSVDKFARSSPKSIYRLADKYDIPQLKRLALDHMRYWLAKCDIVEESFSKFSFQYCEIRSLYVEQLAFSWAGDSTKEATRAGVESKIKGFAKGQLEHATEVLSALWENANNGDGVVAPSDKLPITAYMVCPAHLEPVFAALLESTRSGVFFDRKYWARHSKAGDLKPVYLSSIVMKDKVQKLNELVKHIKCRTALMSDLAGDINLESDCDEDTPGVEYELPDEKDEETRAVLITGSFSAWKSLAFYCCTDAISFAPLKSQGAEPRLNHIRSNTIATVPPPCSPKSIYVLANLLGIKRLCERAVADIKSKVTLENVVSEVFSWTTAGQQEIMEMECDLLVSKFKGLETATLMKESIRQISGGSSSHGAGALQLGLEKAMERKKRLPPATRLRCSSRKCASYNDHIPYSSIGTDDCRCRACSDYLGCASCGYEWTGARTSCRRCEKRFI